MSHILGEDDSDDDFGVFNAHRAQTIPRSTDTSISMLHQRNHTAYESYYSTAEAEQASNYNHSANNYGNTLRPSSSSSRYEGEQSQNAAVYGGGHAANPLGTMQDASLGAYQRGGLYDDEDEYESEKTHTRRRSGNGNSHLGQGKQFGSLRRAPDSEGSAGALPLAATGAPIAGTSPATAPAVDWSLDDDDEEMMGTPRSPGGVKVRRGGWKETLNYWRDDILSVVNRKQKQLTGHRTVYLNDALRNSREGKFQGNSVSTTKYNAVTFVPKFLFEQFSKYANLFFLFTACIQQIPNVSPTNRYTTIAPLSLVLLVAAFKELSEDLKRRASDAELNARVTSVLADGAFRPCPWKKVRVGDIVRLESNEFFPADIVLLSSSEPDGLAYIETSNLDGETNLKIKQASPFTAKIISPDSASAIHGQLRSEHPNNSLYTYEGTLVLGREGGLGDKEVPISPEQMLLRGAQLRNTAWMYGLVAFTGHETKLMRNATAAPIKRTAVERMVNVQIVFLFGILLALSVGSSIGSFIRTFTFGDNMWYLFLKEQGSRVKVFIEDVLTFIILYNNLIPISLIVTMEVVKFQQAILINSDLDMYYAKTDTPALCRTSSLVEELGQIEYVFSDKTGTLTQNIMEFRQLSVGGVAYADVVDENKVGEVFSFAELRQVASGNGHKESVGVVREFLTLLATCHTVIPERKDGKINYQASSPDEAALVAGAEVLEYQFTTRKPQSIIVDQQGRPMEYQVLNILEFNSTRKRMSSIIRTPDGKIKLYCKGADTVILERCSETQPYKEATLNHLEEYATQGLRTLCIAMREIPEEEYRPWATIYDKAAATINGRGEALDKAAELIEKNLFLLGATAIEDKLQDGVPDTIYTLQQAGIKVWVLTGDRQETAINIGLSCRLISESMSLVIVNEESANATSDFIEKKLLAIKNQKNTGDLEDLALIIDGKSLGFALEKSISKSFLELAIMCKAVVCCRVSPLQKALVVKLVKKNIKGSITLAIGDGANDVSMIQAAHVGVGISGVEGLQAARSADVAISQFRFLKKLLLVHGTWGYVRLSKLILYSFYKNIVLYMIGFYFSFFNGFSGQILIESWTLSLYNVLFTVLPPFAIGIFDQYVGARMLDRYPELYSLGQRNAFFTVKIFWEWIANAIFHSVIIFACLVVVFWNDIILTDGLVGGIWIFGTTAYMVVLLTVLGKAALISDLWTKWTLLTIPGSFLLSMIVMPLYALIAPAIGFSLEYQNIVPRLWGDSVFYFCLLVIPVLCLIRDFAWKSYKRLFKPESYHIVQEIQKFNLPDYRPRMEQFQKAIKKVRAVQRMRRNRGYAFSQTEEGQEQLIRSYDTTVAKAKG